MCVSQNQFSLAPEAARLHSAFCGTVAHWGKRIFKGATMKHWNETHGMSGSPEYVTWAGMKQRCYYPKHNRFLHYGGRGIKVCKRWKSSFENFLSDMGFKPSRKHSIERINNDGDYEPSNCKWATNEEQQSNSGNCRRITYVGMTKLVSEWERDLGYRNGLIRVRLNRGWSEERAIAFKPTKNVKTHPI